jgi:hypothetical protein
MQFRKGNWRMDNWEGFDRVWKEMVVNLGSYCGLSGCLGWLGWWRELVVVGEEFVVVEEVVEEFVRVVKEWSRGRRKEGRKKIYFVTFCEFLWKMIELNFVDSLTNL